MTAIANLIRETSTSTGTGNFTLVSAAAAGFRRFSDEWSTGGSNVFRYAIRHTTAVEWEYGLGSLLDANTLIRDTVQGGTNGTSPTNFSAGTKEVYCDVPASLVDDLFDGTLATAAALTAHTGAAAPHSGHAPLIAFARLSAAATVHLSLPGVVTTAVTTDGEAANNLNYYPILVRDDPVTLDSLWCEVTTAAAAGNNVRMGIYSADTDWLPTATLVYGSADVLVDSTGVKSVTGIATVLNPGRYLLVLFVQATTTFRTIRGTIPNSIITPAIGTSPLARYLRHSGGTYGALPSTPNALNAATYNSVNLEYKVFCGITP